MVDEEVKKVTETTTRAGDTTQKTTAVIEPQNKEEHQQNVAERVVWYIAGVLLTILAFRFVLSLLGANRSNAFADFVYSISHPFVAPFFSLFSYKQQFGIATFELFTLVAMAVYALVAYGIARLLTINRK